MQRLGILALGALLLGVPAAGARDSALVVIVHPDRRAALTVADVAHIYLGRRRFWDDGSAIVALNLPAGTPLRERFSRSVLHGDSGRLASYWNEQYFHGVFPPAVLLSTEAVKRYVASDRKAIGYIATSQLDATVRPILTIE